MLKTFIFFIPLFLFSFTGEVINAEESDTSRIYHLDEIVVTATRSEKTVKDLSATVSVITREEIEASNANSCTDILNILPGLFVQKTGAFGRADVNIRGIGDRGRRVMILIDGRPVKMGLFGCTITHSLPLDNVERIEVVRGPLSVLYGSDALGGVINIITRRPTPSEQVDYTFSYGTYDTYQHRLRAGGSRGRLDFYATADKRQSKGHLPNSAYDGEDFTARVDYQVTDGIEATLTAKYFDGHKEEPSPVTDDISSKIWNDYKRGAVDFTVSQKLGRWDLFTKLYRNFGDHEFSDGWKSKDFTNGALISSSGKIFPDNELTVGAEFRQQGGERVSEPRGEWKKSEYAVFFHDEQVLKGKIILTFGGRYNQDEISGSEFSPQAGLVLHPRKGTILRGLINKGFRSPQLNELYPFPPSNENLEAERVWNFEVGVNQRIVDGIDVDFAGYRMRGQNLIQTERISGRIPPFQFQNAGEFDFKGLEACLNAQIGREVSGRVYYTYLDPGEKTKGRPGNKVDLLLRYAKEKFFLSMNGQWVSDYFAEDSSKGRIDDYFVINTKMSYQVYTNLQVFLAVGNLLDREYELYVDLPGAQAGLYLMPKRTITAGVRFQL